MNKKEYIITLIVAFTIILNCNIILSKDINQSKSSKWTLMYYCGGDEAKEIIGAQKLIELFESINYNSNDDINVVALVDYGDAFKGVLMPKQGSDKYEFVIIETYDELNMGDYNTLKNFIGFCKSNYPADRYFLQIVGHANGFFAACFDDVCIDENNDETPNYLTMKEIRLALEHNSNVDIFATTGCYMGSIECAYEFKDVTDIYISSEDIYNIIMVPMNILNNFIILRENPDSTNIEIAELIIEKLNNNCPNDFILSAIRTDKISEFKISFNSFLSYISDEISVYIKKLKRAETYSTKIFFGRDIYDYFDFIYKKSKTTNINSDLEMYVNLVIDSLDNMIIDNIIGNNNNFKGLSFFFEDDDETEFYSSIDLRFTQDTEWDEYLNQYFSYSEMSLKFKFHNLFHGFKNIFISFITSLDSSRFFK